MKITTKKSALAGLGVILGATVLFSWSAAKSQSMSPQGLEFGAPQINGKANVSNPQTGEVVYDSSDNTFYGYLATSAWAALNAPAGSSVPTGSVMAYGASTAPTGYLLCDGSAVSRTTYAPLFAIIGTSFGSGDGTTTFNLPDLRGRFLRGVDGSAGNDPDKTSRTAMASGGNTGNNVGSIQGQATKKNGLALTDPGHGHNVQTNSTNGAAGTAAVYSSAGGVTATIGSAANSNTTGITLGTGDNETRPVNAYVYYIIKY